MSKSRIGVTVVAVAVVLLAFIVGLGGCRGRAELPDGAGTVSTSNPITREQTPAVTAKGRAVTQQIIDDFAANGVDRNRADGTQHYENWGSCQAASTGINFSSAQFANGMQYGSTITFDAMPDIETAVAKQAGSDVNWKIRNHNSAVATIGVFTAHLDWWDDRLVATVWSPCYFIRKTNGVDDRVSYQEIEDLGGFPRREWDTS